MGRVAFAIVFVVVIGMSTPGASAGSQVTRPLEVATVRPSFQGPYRIFRTDQSEFFPGSENQGWWSYLEGNYDENDNYAVGDEIYPDDIRDFFTFDLSALTGTVVRAELIIARYHMYTDDPTETLEFHDVSTDPVTLNANNGPSSDIWADLGTGALYGSYDVPSSAHGEVMRFELNDAAVAGINAAVGGFFSVGGALPTSDAPSEAMFSYSGDPGPQWLVVQLAD